MGASTIRGSIHQTFALHDGKTTQTARSASGKPGQAIKHTATPALLDMREAITMVLARLSFRVWDGVGESFLPPHECQRQSSSAAVFQCGFSVGGWATASFLSCAICCIPVVPSKGTCLGLRRFRLQKAATRRGVSVRSIGSTSGRSSVKGRTSGSARTGLLRAASIKRWQALV